ncbi:c-type cytochrome [Methylocucumis oryzae]|uniref:Cytochrome C n=1 Tax=Methylocucumis oryzae TaxID=1632867 RepID=A0A0F3IGJ2_9GAMM|nr:c-type cytochrome [Methylocucumis oryzae]KJV05648.1 cytochrome C [Methylocucumis oryzae]
MIKALLLLSLLLAANVSFAKPTSQVAWTPELLAKLKHANADKGKTLAANCTSCHGDKGQGSPEENRDGDVIPAIPALAGQLATYTFKQLRDYANDDKDNATMTGIAKNLTEQDAADLALWFSTLPAPSPSGQGSDKAYNLVTEGDGKRIIPPCSVCHGSDGQGEKIDIPALKGQQAGYLVDALTAYKTGARHNDIYARMRLIAEQLTDEEIKALAQYYQALR